MPITGTTSNDTVNGTSGADEIIGLDGDDSLSGFGGEDTLNGGLGNDHLDGGSGSPDEFDWASYGDSASAVTVDLAAGTATGNGTDTLTNIEAVVGSSFADSLTGSSGDNDFAGGGGNDTINGSGGFDVVFYNNATGAVTVNLAAGTASGAGVGTDTLSNIEGAVGSIYNDTMTGSNNDDGFNSGLGNDLLAGGGGNDTLSFWKASGNVTASLLSGLSSGADGNDTFSGFEKLEGGNFNDILTGDTGNNTLYGNGGNDTLTGGQGNDSIDGGSGTDMIQFFDAASAVVVNLEIGTVTGGSGTDTIVSIESSTGTAFNDSLTGSTANNLLDGGNGNDQLRGGDGNDTLVGGEGNDYITGEAGNDSINGGNGTDTADYFFSAPTAGISVNLYAGGGIVFGGDGTDTLAGIENINATDFNDAVYGDVNSNRIEGRNGNDSLFGGDGNDAFVAGTGDDYVDGGRNDNSSGLDSVDYSGATSGVTVNLVTGLSSGGGQGNDTLVSIDGVFGSNFNDTITGGSGFDYIRGGGGDDVLNGGAGTDDIVDYSTSTLSIVGNLATGSVTTAGDSSLAGSGGDDIITGFEQLRGTSAADSLTGDGNNNSFRGNGSNDTIDGAGGLDRVDYLSASGSVGVSLLLNTSSGADGIDTLISIERVRGSGFADTIEGSNSADTLDGSAGDDSIYGNDGDDVILGGDGEDYLTGGLGNDTIDGQQHASNRLDFANYYEATSAVTVNLATGTATGGAGNDVLLNINAVRGSQFADIIVGNSELNFLRGGMGNDTIDGGEEFDFVDYRFSSSAMVVNLANNTTSGGDGADVLSNIEGVWGSDYNDTLIGSSGDNDFSGSLGNDNIDGGLGSDTLVYRSAAGSVAVSLLAGTATGDGTDTFTSIENVIGSLSFGDSLTGDGNNNELQGWGGNDTLDGGVGNDTASYDLSSTTGASVNLASGVAFNDGMNGFDTLISIENVIGSQQADNLTGNTGNNNLQGLDGNDTLIGDAGNDTLMGGKGADTLNGGAGNDVIDGGAITDPLFGTDFNFASYSSATSAINVNFSTGVATDGLGGTDSISNINLVQASAYHDVLTGTSGPLYLEQFEGGLGNDTIDGGVITDTNLGFDSNRVAYFNATGAVQVNFATGSTTGADGNDVLININQVRGSSFADTFTGSNNPVGTTERFEGRAGNDTIDGGGGFDDASYESSTSGIVANLATGVVSDGWGTTDTLLNIEAIRGSNFNDYITGGNTLNGSGATDGLESFRGNAGNDTIDGGVGFDRASYASATEGVIVTLGGTSNGTAQDGLGGTDTLINIEAAEGSIYADVLTGSNSGVFESFQGLLGNDTIDGQGGTDRVDFLNSIAGVSVNLATGTASDGSGGTDTLLNIEDIRGSRDFADVLTGNAGNNRIEGRGGNDTIDGGAGTDTAVYSGVKSGYIITKTLTGYTVAGGADGTDTLSNIEKLIFSDTSVLLKSASSDFDGDGKSDILWRNTATGADTIWKSGDSTTVQAVKTIGDQNWKISGTGDFDGDGKSDILWRNTTTGQDTIWKSGNSTTTQAVATIADQNWQVAGTGDFDGDGKSDILWRNSTTGSNTIWKSGSSTTVQAVKTIADQNWKIAGIGDFDGDGKADILWRNIATGADTIWKSGNSTTAQAVSTLADQDWVIADGLATGDLLTGGAGNNTLYGTVSNDVLQGGAGNDNLTGGLGQDMFRFASSSQGNDTITDFAIGADKLQLVSSGFANLALGTLAAGSFVAGAAPVATTGSAQFLYNTGTGQLSFDANGTGAGGAINLVTLVGTPALTAADLVVVA